MQNMIKIILLIGALTLAGCGPFKPYEVDVQQGNVVDQTLIKELHAGMSKTEVQDLLGTPLLNTCFDEDDWSYVYTNQINGGKIEKKTLELFFAHNKLVKVRKE